MASVAPKTETRVLHRNTAYIGTHGGQIELYKIMYLHTEELGLYILAALNE